MKIQLTKADINAETTFEWWGYMGISPNSQYLYTGPSDSLYQFNITASDVLSTKKLVATVPVDSITKYGNAIQRLALMEKFIWKVVEH